MRIVSGTLKGRVLKGIESLDLRPTSERVREAIFSSLISRIDLKDKKILDLFAGSGALGIEALSRGAGSCVFVEKNNLACKTLKQNIDAFGLTSNSCIENKSVNEFLKTNIQSFDLIFADPPYRTEKEPELIKKLEESNVFKSKSLFLFEDSINTGLESYEKLNLLYRKKYGETLIALFEKQ